VPVRSARGGIATRDGATPHVLRLPEREGAVRSPVVDRPAPSAAAPRTRVAASLRSGRNWRQLAKFCVVGAIGYVINLAVYHTLLGEGLHYLAAATCSFLVAVTSNYTLNRHWTFRDQRAGVATQGMRFFLVSLASLAANLAVLHVLIRYGGVEKFYANAIAIILVTPLNFIGNKLWSFRLPRRRRSA